MIGTILPQSAYGFGLLPLCSAWGRCVCGDFGAMVDPVRAGNVFNVVRALVLCG